MTNPEIARVFERIALILDIKGEENPFRIRAYERAAMMITNLSKDLKDVYEEGGLHALENLPGIGRDLSEKIEELLKTGKLSALHALEKKVPPGLLEVMAVEGMGPKRTKFVWQRFRVKNTGELKHLAESGKLTKMKGWGRKSVENILRGIKLKKKMAGRLPIGDALPLGDEIENALRKTGLCEKVAIAGSLRRRRETCGDIDILVTSKYPGRVMDAFCSLPHVESVTVKGTTKSTVFLKAGIDCDLRVVDLNVFGAALHYFTGSKDHNVRIRKMGVKNGITISEYGVYKGTAKRKGKLIAAKTEEDVYRAIGLPYIEPELRENRGEIETALDGRLPTLLKKEDIKGDLHIHSTFSDGSASMIDMARAAKERGYDYIAITDHASPMGIVKGVKKTNIKTYLKEIEKARKAVPGIHILAGAEVDILDDGRLYLADDILAKLDWVVASIHQGFRQSRDRATKRMLTALKNPHISVLGHPTTRMLGKREGIDLDMDMILEEARRQHVAVELNASPERLDLNDIHLKRAKELGVKICINSDAHAPHSLSLFYGIFQARRGWLEKKDVLNTMTWKELEK